MVRVHLKQQLQKSMNLITRWHESLLSCALCLRGKLCKRGRKANVLTQHIRERGCSCPGSECEAILSHTITNNAKTVMQG